MAICMCVDAKDYVDMKDKAEKAETVHVYTACHYKADGQRTCKIAPVYMSVCQSLQHSRITTPTLPICCYLYHWRCITV